MSTERRCANGKCGVQRDGIVPNVKRMNLRWHPSTLRGRIANWFSWDEGWGFPLRGWPMPMLSGVRVR